MVKGLPFAALKENLDLLISKHYERFPPHNKTFQEEFEAQYSFDVLNSSP